MLLFLGDFYPCYNLAKANRLSSDKFNCLASLSVIGKCTAMEKSSVRGDILCLLPYFFVLFSCTQTFDFAFPIFFLFSSTVFCCVIRQEAQAGKSAVKFSCLMQENSKTNRKEFARELL